MPDAEMNEQTNTSSIGALSVSSGNVPDWSLIQFDVCCGRCSAKLNGSTDSACPICGLELEWASVLPIQEMQCPQCEYKLFGLTGKRCPECGQSFEWQQILEAARSRHRGLLEYQWRERGLRALFRTWWLAAFRPFKLWREHDINATPKVVPLLAFAVLQWTVFILGWPAVGEVADWAMNEISQRLELSTTFTYKFHRPDEFFWLILLTQIATFFSFQLLFETKRKFNIRWQHFLRVFIHATAFAAFTPALACIVEVGMDASPQIWPTFGPYTLAEYHNVRDTVLATGVLATWLGLWIGFRRYLKLPQASIVAASCLVLGFLAAKSFLLIIDPLVRLRLFPLF